MSALLTHDEAAARLHVSPKTLRSIRQRGLIRYVAVTPRTIRYRPEDCDAFVERQARVEVPIEPSLPRGRARPRPKNDGNVLSFTARRQARRQGLGR